MRKKEEKKKEDIEKEEARKLYLLYIEQKYGLKSVEYQNALKVKW